MMKSVGIALGVGVALFAAACASDDAGPVFQVEAIYSPASPGSAEPNLSVAPDGSVLISWLAPHGQLGSALQYAAFTGDGWSSPVTIASGDDWFVNWADFPAVAADDNGMLIAHWLVKSAPDTYAYDVVFSSSSDGGATWSAPVRPHRDGTRTEHGFVSFVPRPGGGFLAVWLDGRETGGGGHGDGGHGAGAGAMTLRCATVGEDGAIGPDLLLDDRVCDCCPTDAVATDDGVLVAYRDRSPGEIRDIYVVRQTGDSWSDPVPVHDDAWEIAGCPVNGPALAARGNRVVCVWFTGEGDDPRVMAAFSEDAGASFGEPVRVDDGSTMGRVDVEFVSEKRVIASWMEASEEAGTIKVRMIDVGGEASPSFVAGTSTSARSSGFPQLAPDGAGSMLLAWTEPRSSETVRTVRLSW